MKVTGYREKDFFKFLDVVEHHMTTLRDYLSLILINDDVNFCSDRDIRYQNSLVYININIAITL